MALWSRRWWSKYPVISTRNNGDRLIGERGPLAADLYAAGTPPCHGTRVLDSGRVARVRIGDSFAVLRDGAKWYVMDGEHRVAVLRWRPGDDAKPHATTGVMIRLPSKGTLQVERVLVSPDGTVIDVLGRVVPD